MTKSAMYKKFTYEDKFDRRWWADGRAKRSWIKFTKANNNRKFRRLYKQIDKDIF